MRLVCGPRRTTESHSTARHQFLSRISSVVRFSAGTGEDATSHEPHRSISNGLGMARSGLAGVSRFVSCKCDAHFSVHPFPPRFPNIGVSPVSARAGNERGRCLLLSVHDSYNPLLWWSDVETHLLLVVLHGQLSACCRGDPLHGCSRVCGRKNRAVLNTEPSVDSSAVPVLDHDLLHGREVRNAVRKAELQSRIGAVSVEDGEASQNMDTAGATQSCASNTLGTRCFGLHDGAANLVAVWRIDRLNLVRVAHVCDRSHV